MFDQHRHATAAMRIRLGVCALLLGIASGAALAEPPHWREQYRDNGNRNNSGDKRAVRDMVGEIEHNYRGHVIDVQPPAADQDQYRVRVLQEGGRVKTLHVPARESDRGRNR